MHRTSRSATTPRHHPYSRSTRGPENNATDASVEGSLFWRFAAPFAAYTGISWTRRFRALGGDQEGRRPDRDTSNFLRNNRTLVTNIQPEDDTNKDKKTPTKVTSVDYHICENRKEHRTDEYERQSLIVRRGQSFKVTVHFDKDLDSLDDRPVFQFVTGNLPQQSKGAIIRLSPSLEAGCAGTCKKPAEWKCRTVEIPGEPNSLSVEITPASNALIGVYKFFIETSSPGAEGAEDDKVVFRKEEDEIFLLFNAWCPDDVVFLDNDKWRREYVLNDRGRIWTDSSIRHTGKPWNFGQFDEPCLEAAMMLLEKAELSESARSSVVSVVRAMTAVVNSMDDDGVLEGRWTNDYPADSTLPWAWNGSVAILQEYMETGKPVRFGQCWVFSGVLTTLLRTLGIATRSVTNFSSAHDTDASMTIDFHWDEDGDPVEWRNDSVWNFHVWNESWMQRRDLPEGYDGWQVLDATPQEMSEGVMRCGPASLRAIREGRVYLNYDIPFVFAEVNADRINWAVSKDGDMEIINVENNAVGRYISTKAVGTNAREDITCQYKYQEGSMDEARVLKFVNRYSCRKVYQEPTTRPVLLNLLLPEDPEINQDFTVSAQVKNQTGESLSLALSLSVVGAFYTGVSGRRISSINEEFTLTAGEEKILPLTVTEDEYEPLINHDAIIQVFARCKEAHTKQTFAKQDSFKLQKPTVDLLFPAEVNISKAVTAEVKFRNPIKRQLTGGVIRIEGSGLLKPIVIKHEKKIKIKEEISHSFTILPTKCGEREIMATFSSNELTEIIRCESINVLAV